MRRKSAKRGPPKGRASARWPQSPLGASIYGLQPGNHDDVPNCIDGHVPVFRTIRGAMHELNRPSNSQSPDMLRDNHTSIIMSSRTFWTIALLEVALGMLALILRYPLRIFLDCAANLYYGQLLIQGKLPYIDFVDTDPPMIVYLNAIPAFISKIFHLNPILVFSLGILFIAVCTSVLCAVVLQSLHIDHCTYVCGLVVFVFLTLSLAFWIFNIGCFGQREHLFVMLYFPYCLVRCVRWERGTGRLHIAIPIAILCGVVTCVKPHFLLAAVGPEVYWAVTNRTARSLFTPEAIAFACTGLAFALHFLFLPIAVTVEVFCRWLPFLLQRYYVYGCPTRDLVMSTDTLFAGAMIAAPFVLSWKARQCASMARSLAVFTGAGFVMYFVQHTGWEYHRIPMIYGSLLVWSIICAEVRSWSNRWLPQRVGVRLLMLVIGWSAVASLAIHWYGFSRRSPVSELVSLTMAFGIVVAVCMKYLGDGIYRCAASNGLGLPFGVGRLLGIVLLGIGAWYAATGLTVQTPVTVRNETVEVVSKHTVRGDPILFISTSPDDAFPLMLMLNRRPGSRYLWQFPIAMFYAGVHGEGDRAFPYHVGDGIPEDEKCFLRELAEDIHTLRPRLILVRDDGRFQGCPEGFVLSEYLQEVGFMDWAMRGYINLPRTSRYLVFALPMSR